MVWSLARFNSGTETVLLAEQALPIQFSPGVTQKIRLKVVDNGSSNPVLAGYIWDPTGNWVELFSEIEDTSGSKITAAGLPGYLVTFNENRVSAATDNYGVLVKKFTLDNTPGGGGGGGGGLGSWSVPGEPASVGELTVFPEAPDTRRAVWETSQLRTDRGYIVGRAQMSISRARMSATWVLDATDFATVHDLLVLAMKSKKSFGMDLDNDGSQQYFIVTDAEIATTRIATNAFRLGPVSLLEVFPT